MSDAAPGPGPRALVFTDLDGTLLDRVTYDFDPARPALAACATRGIPVIPVTSKTLAEVAPLRTRLGLDGPAVVESGGVVWYPEPGRPEGRSDVRPPGYAALRQALEEIRRECDLPLVGFGDLDALRIAEQTGLPPAEAARSRTRLADEPFFATRALEAAEEERLARAVAERGLALQTGGRFRHLVGVYDKGAAVREILAWYAPAGSARPASLGLGDAPNDSGFLAVVDRAVAVPGPDGVVAPELAAVPGVSIAPAPGPAGWNAAVLQWLAPQPEAA